MAQLFVTISELSKFNSELQKSLKGKPSFAWAKLYLLNETFATNLQILVFLAMENILIFSLVSAVLLSSLQNGRLAHFGKADLHQELNH